MTEDIREIVKQTYSQAITKRRSCCGDSGDGCCSSGSVKNAADVITGDLYRADEMEGLPEDIVATSFGCGNPTALSELYPGEVVLDLGSGAGLDVLLSARRVGPCGKAYGLDMTDEMLAEARANQAKAKIDNVEFIKGHIEEIPLPDNVIDVIISNCVINLSANKDQVLKESYRVLKPGGRFAVSDIVLTRDLPSKVQQDLMAWAGCVAGALREQEYKGKLAAVGFTDIEIQITRVYDFDSPEAKSIVPGLSQAEYSDMSGSVVSAFIRAKKPALALIPGIDYQIRNATIHDYTGIQNILSASGLPTDGVEENLPYFLVAVEVSEVVGVVGMEWSGTSAMLRSLAVSTNRRKSGIASALVDRALEEVRKAGGNSVYLLTNTAERYMKRRGFRVIKRSEIPGVLLEKSALHSTCPSSSTCMQLELNK